MDRNKQIVVGFSDEARLVRALAKQLHVKPVFAAMSRYAAGEMAVSLSRLTLHTSRFIVVANVREAPESLFRVLLLAEALRVSGARHVTLIAPWIAYGRQDRAVKPGESPAGLVVARLLKGAFDRIVTLDAHSPAFQRAFGSRLVNVLPPVESVGTGFDVVAAPDHGARGRALRVARAFRVPCVQLEKRRRGTSVIGMRLVGRADLSGKRVLLIDDMADSGSTLFEAARVLRQAGAKRVDAFVTHAIDLKKLKHKSRGRLESVSAAFDHANNDYLITILSLLTSTVT